MAGFTVDFGHGPMIRWQRPVFLTVSALAVVAVVFLARDVMLPVVLGTIIAYVLAPLVAWTERRRVPRALAIIVVYVAVLGTMGVFIRAVAPRMGQEISNFTHELPGLSAKVKTQWIPTLQSRLRALTGAPHEAEPDKEGPEPAFIMRPRGDGSFALDVEGGVFVRGTRSGYILDKGGDTPQPFDPDRFITESVHGSVAYVQHNALELARIGGGIVFGVGRFFFVFGLTLMIAAYLIITRERIVGFFMSLVRPSARPSFQLLLNRVDRGLSGVVRGQIIICLINGVLSAIGFAIVGLKYWPVLTIVATLLSLIPIFGSIISSVPAVALGLTQSFGTGVFVLVWIIGIHQLEANFLNPKIMGDSAKIHPVLVIFSLLVGEHFFHATGALLAVPCMSIAQSVFTHFRQIVQETDPELAREPVASVPPPPVSR
jgi:predicted PurR-regulated permease PerM